MCRLASTGLVPFDHSGLSPFDYGGAGSLYTPFLWWSSWWASARLASGPVVHGGPENLEYQ